MINVSTFHGLLPVAYCLLPAAYCRLAAAHCQRRPTRRDGAGPLVEAARGGTLSATDCREVLPRQSVEGGRRRVREVSQALREERGRALCPAQVVAVPGPPPQAEHRHQGRLPVGSRLLSRITRGDHVGPAHWPH